MIDLVYIFTFLNLELEYSIISHVTVTYITDIVT